LSELKEIGVSQSHELYILQSSFGSATALLKVLMLMMMLV